MKDRLDYKMEVKKNEMNEIFIHIVQLKCVPAVCRWEMLTGVVSGHD